MNRRLLRRGLLPLLLLAASWAQAVVETYDFSDESRQHRYTRFTEELRCPKCQNQNLAGSNAPIAADLRRELHRMLEEGKSDQEIVDFMVDRYGEFVLYRPRFNGETAVLWFAPGAFLLVGLIAVVVIYRRQKSPEQLSVDDAPLNDEERDRLNRLLNESAKGHSDV